jgi:purine-binding chemotaxis protein CheW
MSETQNAVEQSQFLTFHLAGEEYAVGILHVKEIIEYGTVTKVPQTPPSIRGVINLRGNVVPVVDLAVRFGFSPTAVTARTCIIITEVAFDGERAIMGVIADAVSKVITLSPEDILPAPAFGTRVRADFLRGMGQGGKKFVLILDIDKVLCGVEQQAAATLEAISADAPASEKGADPAHSRAPLVKNGKRGEASVTT